MEYHATGSAGGRTAAMVFARAGWLSLLLCGCSSALSAARSSFDEARYPDAVAQYRAIGPLLPELARPELFEYALYRGLSHLALGDATRAEFWLSLAKRLSQETPSVTTSEQRGRLQSARRAMGHMPGE